MPRLICAWGGCSELWDGRKVLTAGLLGWRGWRGSMVNCVIPTDGASCQLPAAHAAWGSAGSCGVLACP